MSDHKAMPIFQIMQAKLVRLLPYLTKASNSNTKLEQMDHRDLMSHVSQQKT
jgi:hypothetical protein